MRCHFLLTFTSLFLHIVPSVTDPVVKPWHAASNTVPTSRWLPLDDDTFIPRETKALTLQTLEPQLCIYKFSHEQSAARRSSLRGACSEVAVGGGHIPHLINLSLLGGRLHVIHFSFFSPFKAPVTKVPPRFRQRLWIGAALPFLLGTGSLFCLSNPE